MDDEMVTLVHPGLPDQPIRRKKDAVRQYERQGWKRQTKRQLSEPAVEPVDPPKRKPASRKGQA